MAGELAGLSQRLVTRLRAGFKVLPREIREVGKAIHWGMRSQSG
jgi:hypothetical protein